MNTKIPFIYFLQLFSFLLHPSFLISKTSKETYQLPIYRSHQMDNLDINARFPWRKVVLESPRYGKPSEALYCTWFTGCLNSATSICSKRKQNLRKYAVRCGPHFKIKTKMADPIWRTRGHHSRPDTCKKRLPTPLHPDKKTANTSFSNSVYPLPLHSHEMYMYVIWSYRSEAASDEDHCMKTSSPQETQARARTETTGPYALLSTRMASLRGEDLVS